ncbi:UNVERIFIED_CONTAM: hypothetical protein Slati_1372900 [Sesamum latifolium]|uniref:Reverse transcriptase zinc-binding domain-containing protein n=1 Tax=Sesamum latifolium TaxID=2727402 RepID=A0AAW2XJJ7_9LAMI
MNPDSLLSHLLKHKYFSNTDVLTVPASHGCSFTWKSMLEARSVILSRTSWLLGDGTKVCVWHDRWIPWPVFIPGYHPPVVLSLDATMDALFQEGSEGWNEDLNGCYSVRSAYNLVTREGGTRNASSFSSSSSAYWNFIWHVAVPPKVQLFTWKVCCNSLATNSNLQRHGVQPDGGCTWCGGPEDDLLHVLGAISLV